MSVINGLPTGGATGTISITGTSSPYTLVFDTSAVDSTSTGGTSITVKNGYAFFSVSLKLKKAVSNGTAQTLFTFNAAAKTLIGPAYYEIYAKGNATLCVGQISTYGDTNAFKIVPTANLSSGVYINASGTVPISGHEV